MEIKGKSALVTGAGQGIGEASAMMLAEAGAKTLVIADINAENLNKVATAAEKYQCNVIPKVVDVSQWQNVVEMIREADEETGGLDIVHNNAGIMSGGDDFPDSPVEMMAKVIEINLTAMMVGTRIAVECMRGRNAGGVIINTSSVAAFSTMPADPAYAASKIGILNFTQSCGPLHEQFGIRVMAVCPGVVDTAIVPHDAEWLKPALAAVKFLEPADIANAVKTIVEDDSLAGDQITVQNEPLQ